MTETAIDRLADAYWQAVMVFEPLYATQVGDRRYDALLPDRSAEAIVAYLEHLRSIEANVGAIDPTPLDASDRITRSALIEQIASDTAALTSGLDEWTVDPIGGPHMAIMDVESYQPIRSVAEGRDLVARWQAVGPWLDAAGERVRRAAGSGRVAVATPIRRVIDEIDSIVETPDEDDALLAPARAPHDEWDAADAAAFREAVAAAVHDVIRPALGRYRASLERDVLPLARPDERPGLCHLPGGDGAYAGLIRAHTSLPLTADELHATGRAEIARIRDELAELGSRVLGTADVPDIQRRLRSDPALHFATRDEIFDTAVRAMERANAAIEAWFGILPVAPCEVVRMGAHEEAHSTLAFYREPAPDGSRPGRYYINTSAPETRPRYDAEALGYHESVPGHHLQIAIAQEIPGLPIFRRHLGTTAFVEGWGLYTERLADEMGLYSGDLDRIGVLSYDGWRASRLVVDTGMHAMGWTRQQAIDYMTENTVLAANNIANEVDRYITWPAQALAYKTGQLELFRLRAGARDALGSRFDVRAFHDAVLGAGAVPLETLRDRVAGWVASASG